MKKTITSKLVLLMSAMALFISSCSTNATFTKRYHNRGFNIAWGGGGSNTNNNTVKQLPKKVKSKTENVFVTENAERLAVQSVNSSKNAVVNTTNQNPELTGNSIITQNGTSVKNYFKSTADIVKSTHSKTKKSKVNIASKPRVKANQKEYDPREGKSQKRALVMGIILGIFGAHRFYLGYKKIGFIQLAITVVYVITEIDLILIPVLIWAIYDVIRIYKGTLEPKDGYYLDSLDDY